MNTRGKKRSCNICGSHFYDLNKLPPPENCYRHRTIFKSNLSTKLIEKYKVRSPGFYIPQRFYSIANKEDVIYSEKILGGLKDCNLLEINFFSEYLNNLIDDDYDENLVICCVPSSKANNFMSGVHNVINEVCKKRKFINGYDFLIRTEDVKKKHLQSGIRTKEKDIETIQIKKSNLFKEKKVLLIDDILTSGNSIYVCRDKIKVEEPLDISLFVFGITKNDF